MGGEEEYLSPKRGTGDGCKERQGRSVESKLQKARSLVNRFQLPKLLSFVWLHAGFGMQFVTQLPGGCGFGALYDGSVLVRSHALFDVNLPAAILHVHFAPCFTGGGH